jgi:hypothetical protein
MLFHSGIIDIENIWVSSEIDENEDLLNKVYKVPTKYIQTKITSCGGILLLISLLIARGTESECCFSLFFS